MTRWSAQSSSTGDTGDGARSSGARPSGARPGRARRVGIYLSGIVLTGGLAACTLDGAPRSTMTSNGAQTSSSASSSSSTSSGSATSDASGGAGAIGSSAWTAVATRAAPSVVSISVRDSQGSGGEGSGVVIDSRGHVLTNNHVVAAAARGAAVQVSFEDATVVPAELVGNDPSTDLAVIKLASVPQGVQPMEFGDSEKLQVADPVMALGNPLSLSDTVTLGIVSALDRPVTTQGEGGSSGAIPVVTNAIQTDAAVNPGNSGGALINGAGQLVGINSSIASLGAAEGQQGGSIGLGFAIPATQAQWVSQELIATGRVQHAYLGVTPENAVVKIDGTTKQVARIVSVAPGTPAAEAGLKQGDSVTKVGDEVVADALALVAQVRERKPGTEVELTVVNANGQARTVSVKFGTRPS